MFLSVNGVRASSRYVMCNCDCHDGEQTARDTIIAGMAHWNPEPLTSAALADMARYVDATNAIISASGSGGDPSESGGDRDGEDY